MTYLQKIEIDVTFDDLVGLDNLRQWIEALAPAIRKADHLSPRGVILAGIPGTGKASCVLAMAKLIDRPVVRYHPGESKAHEVITELGDSPVVLWLDEPDESCIELLRLLALQPRIRIRVFVIASTSNPHRLPTELVHSTAFDRIFHLDLPDLQRRATLWDCLIERVGGEPTRYDNVKLAQVNALFTPGEILTVARMTHAGTTAPPSEKSILAEIVRRTPCAATADEKVSGVRHWARTCAEAA